MVHERAPRAGATNKTQPTDAAVPGFLASVEPERRRRDASRPEGDNGFDSFLASLDVAGANFRHVLVELNFNTEGLELLLGFFG